MGLLAEYHTGGLEKRSPLPQGRYWIDVFEPNIPTMNDWLIRETANVKLVNQQHFDAGGTGNAFPEWLKYVYLPQWVLSEWQAKDFPAHDWYLFQVLQNDISQWSDAQAEQMGYPTVADSSIGNSDDTVQKPNPVQEAADKWGWVKWAVGGAIVVGGIYSVAKLVRG